MVRLHHFYGSSTTWADPQLPVVLGMDRLVPSTLAPILQALLAKEEEEEGDQPQLANHTYVKVAESVHLDLQQDQ